MTPLLVVAASFLALTWTLCVMGAGAFLTLGAIVILERANSGGRAWEAGGDAPLLGSTPRLPAGSARLVGARSEAEATHLGATGTAPSGPYSRVH
jgi:hypothetical protein